MRWCIVVAVVVLCLVGPGVSRNAAAADDDKLDGTWKLIGGEAEGKALTKNDFKGGKLVLKGNQYTVTLAGKDTVTGTQKLDGTKTPKTIDIKDDSGANKGKIALGIYAIKGDEFHVTFAPPGKDRPGKFATMPDSGQWKHVWKRVKD